MKSNLQHPAARATPLNGQAPDPPAAKPAAVAVQPIELLLVTAAVAANLCSTSRPTWDRWTASGANPAPRRIGGRPLWSVLELREWISSGCPDRKTWEAMRDAAQRSGRR